MPSTFPPVFSRPVATAPRYAGRGRLGSGQLPVGLAGQGNAAAVVELRDALAPELFDELPGRTADSATVEFVDRDPGLSDEQTRD
jgi:hypothetical protein